MSRLSLNKTIVPDIRILNAFNLSGNAYPLAGGQNNSWNVGEFVLKYVGTDNHYEWVASTLSQLKPEGYRISKPVISIDNRFVYNGWTCYTYEPGTFIEGREEEKLHVSRLFHHSLAGIDISRYHPANDRWQEAHRVAWSDSSGNRRLQLVHGDLAGNILFHDVLPPLIIDFSPTLAPVEYAEAILIADSIAWHHAPLSTLQLLPQNDLYKGMLLRAVNFRLAVAQLSDDNDEVIRTHEAFGKVINFLSPSFPTTFDFTH
jgi:hypothetical protein